MTTSKYYIPSGRLIQSKSYISDAIITAAEGEDEEAVYHTQNGREVVSGAGIAPDKILEENRIPAFVNSLWRDGHFLAFAASYAPQKNLKAPIS